MTNFSREEMEFFRNMNLFRYGKVNQTTFELLYKAILTYLQKDNSDLSIKLYNFVQNEYNVHHSSLRFNSQKPVWITIWTFICLIGIVGNTFVMTVFCRNKQHVVYEIFCIGLAIADLSFLLLTVPITILHYLFNSWVFGNFLCRFVNFISYGTMFSSAIMLLSLTASRFLSVVRPWDHRNMTIKGAITACTFAYIAGYLCSIPIAVYFNVLENPQHFNNSISIKRCQDNFPTAIVRQIYFSAVLTFTYLLPFIGIISMNCKIVFALRKEGMRKSKEEGNHAIPNQEGSSKRDKRQQQRRTKVTRLVIVITMTYCICWLPTQLLNVWYYTSPVTFHRTKIMQYAKTISQTVSYASACLNFFIYSIISQSFQSSVKKQFPKFYQIVSCAKTQRKGTTFVTEVTNHEFKPTICPKESYRLVTSL